MHDHNHNNHNKNGNINNSFSKPVAQNDGQWENNPALNQNHPHHRNYVERVIDYKFVPVMPINMNQQPYNNSQPIIAQQPNSYYQPTNSFPQSQQPLLQQFIVPPSAPLATDFNNYQFQPAFFEPPFSSMSFDNFYPGANMLNPMDFNFNNNQNNFMPNFPNPVDNNPPAGFNNYNANNNPMYNNQPGYQYPNQQPQQTQANVQPAAINNQWNEKVEKYGQQLDDINNKYDQSNNSKEEVFDEKLTNLEEKIIKLKNKLSEADLFEDEIAEDATKIDLETKNVNSLKENQKTSAKTSKNLKVKKALIVTALLVLFIGIAVAAYFGYTLWLKDILINKLKWKWLI